VSGKLVGSAIDDNWAAVRLTVCVCSAAETGVVSEKLEASLRLGCF
jgi:hypothetical protein